MQQLMTEPNEALRILARIIAKAYLADCQGDGARTANARERSKKGENLPGATRDSSDGEGSHKS